MADVMSQPAPTTAHFKQPAAGSGVELDMNAATPIANSARTKIALMLAAFQDFVTLRPRLLQAVCSQDESPCHQIFQSVNIISYYSAM
jgi:hypothetical protein